MDHGRGGGASNHVTTDPYLQILVVGVRGFLSRDHGLGMRERVLPMSRELRPRPKVREEHGENVIGKYRRKLW